MAVDYHDAADMVAEFTKRHRLDDVQYEIQLCRVSDDEIDALPWGLEEPADASDEE